MCDNLPLYQRSWFNWLILFFITAALGWFFYEKGFRPFADVGFVAENEIGRPVVKKLPEGVEVVEKEDKKVVTDRRNNIEFTIEKNWNLIYADSKTLYFAPPNLTEDNADRGLEIMAHGTLSSSGNFQAWTKSWIKNSNCPDCYAEPILIQNGVYKVVDEGALGDIINYFVNKNGKIYQITVFDDELPYNEVIKNIKFNL